MHEAAAHAHSAVSEELIELRDVIFRFDRRVMNEEFHTLFARVKNNGNQHVASIALM